MNFNSIGAYGYGHLLHMFFCLLILLAIVLIIIWAIRFAKKEEIKKLVTVLLIIGVLGAFLTATLGGFGGYMYGPKGAYGPSMMGTGAWNCAQDEDRHEAMENAMDQMMGIEE